jgi:hypothetical protein
MIGAMRAGMRPERDERPETSEVIVLEKVYLGPLTAFEMALSPLNGPARDV